VFFISLVYFCIEIFISVKFIISNEHTFTNRLFIDSVKINKNVAIHADLCVYIPIPITIFSQFTVPIVYVDCIDFLLENLFCLVYTCSVDDNFHSVFHSQQKLSQRAFGRNSKMYKGVSVHVRASFLSGKAHRARTFVCFFLQRQYRDSSSSELTTFSRNRKVLTCSRV
jgi:hypothetical protein